MRIRRNECGGVVRGTWCVVGFFRTIFVFCLLGLLLIACSTADPEPTPTAFPTATEPIATLAPTAEAVATVAEPTATSLPSATPSPLSSPEGELRPGDKVSGVVSDGSASVWQFSAVAGDTISMTIRPADSGLDVVVNVLNAEGTSILPSGPVDTSFGVEQLTGLVIPSDGVYFVWLEDFLGAGGEYDLAFGSAEGNWLVPGTVVIDALPAGESHDYPFSVLNETDLTFFVVPFEELDAIIEIVDRNGLVVASSDVGFAGELDLLAFSPPAGGQFVARVRGVNGEAGRYRFGLSTPSTALVSATGSLEAGGLTEYSFSVPAGAELIVYAQPDPALDVSLGLYDPAGQRVVAEDTNYEGVADYFTHTTVAAGEHTLRLTSFGETVGNFTVTVLGSSERLPEPPEETEPDPEDTAPTLTRGSFLTVALESDETARLSFEAEAEERIIVYGLPSDEADVVLAIHDASDTRLASTDDGFTGEGEVLVFVAPAGGTYELLVQEFGGRDSVHGVGWVDVANAYLIETGSIEDTPDDYVVTAPAGSQIIALILPDPTFDIILQVDNRTTDVGITGEPEIITFVVTDSGDYPIQISGFSGSTGTYELIVLIVEG